VFKLESIDWWREKCLENLYFLCRVVLCTLEDPIPGYKDLYRPTHKHLCDFIAEHGRLGEKVLLFFPRGWIKSYIVTVGWVIQRLLNNLVQKKHDSILISNATLANAQNFLKKIKYNIQYNELLRGLFSDVLPKNPEVDAARWTMDEIEISGNLIQVGSVEGNLVSRHYRVLIHDDLVSRENSATSEQVQKVIDWWKLAQSLLEAKGLEILIGTRWRFNDLYGHIIETFLDIPCEIAEDSRKRPVFEWHTKNYHYLRYLCWEDPINEKGSTFPTLFPEERLKQIQREQGEHFAGQYLNDPLAAEDLVFCKSWISFWSKDTKPLQRVTIQLVDPAGGKGDIIGKSFTGQVVVDACPDKKLYVLYGARKKGTDVDMVRWMIETACQYQSDIIGVEEHRFRAFVDLTEFIVQQMLSLGQIPPHLKEFALRLPYRMVELKHHKSQSLLFEVSLLMANPRGVPQS